MASELGHQRCQALGWILNISKEIAKNLEYLNASRSGPTPFYIWS